MVCLATIALGALITALLIPTMINNDWHRAKFVFFYGLIAMIFQQIACMIDGDFGGWIAFFLIVVVSVMLVLGHLGYLDTKEAKRCPPPRPLPRPPPSASSGSSGSSASNNKPPTIPMCLDCPGVDYCPPPTCI